MFYAMLNSFRKEELRVAFAGGRNANAAHNFIESVKRTDPAFYEEAQEDGYNERDMSTYLKWLQENGHIKQFKLITYGRDNFKFKNIFYPRKSGISKVYRVLLCGDSSKNIESREKAVKAIKEAEKKIDDPYLKYLAGVEKYDKFCKSYRGGAYRHGVVVTIYKDHKYMYDTGKNVELPFTMAHMVKSVVRINYAYLFDISI
jgi:hypothetical protein